MSIDVLCREVGPRDGLQIIKTFFPTQEKIRWIREEAAAGVPAIQVCSFVPPAVIPQFADAAEVAQAALAIEGLDVSVLVPNLKGAQAAVAIGATEIGYMASVSEAHSRSNLRRSREEVLEEFRRIAAFRDSLPPERRFKLTSGLSTAFGCSLQGHVEPREVLDLAARYVEAGTEMLAVADTVGFADPFQVKSLVGEMVEQFGSRVEILAHFHDTRGLGLANAFAAYEAGCRKFDATLAGLGGCPYAPKASGNVVFEDLVFMFESAGLRTGIDLDRLMPIRDILAANLPHEPLHGAYAEAGPCAVSAFD